MSAPERVSVPTIKVKAASEVPELRFCSSNTEGLKVPCPQVAKLLPRLYVTVPDSAIKPVSLPRQLDCPAVVPKLVVMGKVVRNKPPPSEMLPPGRLAQCRPGQCRC